MQTGFISVPFKTKSGVSQIKGIGKFSAAGIVLEYEGKIFGVIKSGIKESRLALEDILNVKLRKGVFKIGAKIEIRTKSFAKLSETPNRNGKIILDIRRENFGLAQDAVIKLQKDLIEQQAAPPPPHTPVTRLFTEEDEADKDN
ncbi:MAG: hypothetical protein ACR2LT_04645 [Pyrinomonadaceae bacterium]